MIVYLDDFLILGRTQRVKEASGFSFEDFRSGRVQTKCEEMLLGSKTEVRVPRPVLGHKTTQGFLAGAEEGSAQDSGRGAVANEIIGDGTAVLRKGRICSKGSSFRKDEPQTVAASHYRGLEVGLVHTKPGDQEGDPLVVLSPRRGHAFTREGFFNSSVNRRINVRLGSSLDVGKAKGRWSPLERENHINYLDLLAVYGAIMIFRKELQNKVVSLQLDNVTAASYLMKEGGTRSQVFNRLARQISFTCRESSIHLKPAYLPGIANLGADALSRDKQLQEWALNPKVARTIFRIFGRPQVDLFASRRSALPPQYFSIDRKDKKALGVDALELTWKFQLMYAFPPPQLIPMISAKIRMTKATLILVAPFWTKARCLPN